MKIAIQGHLTRGHEVIQILENLGGKNIHELSGMGKDCVYYYNIGSCGIIMFSSKHDLCDHKFYTLEEFEKEFPFKVGDKVIHKEFNDFFEVISFNPGSSYPYKIKGVCEFNTKSHVLTKWQPKMKEERFVTLTLDKAKEWYKKGGELKEIALQAFSEKELYPLPRSWDEYCRKYKFVCLSTRRANISLKYDALIKLEQLRNCWWNGWKPEWNNCEKYVIKWDNNDLIVFTAKNIRAFLVFPTREMAKEFLECFRDLIEKTGDLI